MSAPTLRKHDNGVFYIHWTDGRRSRRVSTGAKGLAEAKAFLGSWLLMEATAPTDAGATRPINDLWRAYDERHVERTVAAPRTARFCWKNLEPHFGALPPAAVTSSVIDAYVEKRKAGKIGRPSKPATIRRELVVLLACLNWCADDKRRLIGAASVPKIDLPADSPPKDRWLTAGEIDRLLAAAEAARTGPTLTRLERFLWLALETGARKGALYDLTWDRVDFETGMIHLNPVGRVQTKKRRADVPISQRLRPVLERAFRERTGHLVLGHKSKIEPALADVCAKAKLQGVSPHVLRHTAATQMARRGVPLYDIAGVLGNGFKVVEKVYAKHCPDRLRAAVNAIGGRAEAAG